MRRALAILIALTVFSPLSAWGAGSCTFTERSSNSSAGIFLQWVCTSDAAGSVSAPTITGTGYDYAYHGRIDDAWVIPGTGGNQPTNGFVVKLHTTTDTTDDLLGAIGAACSNVNTLHDTPLSTTNGFPRALRGEVVRPYASGVGNAKQFTLKIFLKDPIRK